MLTTAKLTFMPGWTFDEIDFQNFSWGDIPKIRADIKAKYGKDLGFTMRVNTPDGSYWQLKHEPASWLENKYKELFGKKKRAK